MILTHEVRRYWSWVPDHIRPPGCPEYEHLWTDGCGKFMSFPSKSREVTDTMRKDLLRVFGEYEAVEGRVS